MIVVYAYWLWLVFIVTWWMAAVWTAKATSYGRAGQRIGYFLGFGLGFTLLFSIPPLPWHGTHIYFTIGSALPLWWRLPLWRSPIWVSGALLAAQAGLFAFAWWARVHLGKLWSGMLTLREGHRVVDTGPYALVRHPIYTAFIGASWTLALIAATPVALLGAVVLTIVMSVKAKAEEELLRRELGPASYDAYRARVPMLVPFAPR